MIELRIFIECCTSIKIEISADSRPAQCGRGGAVREWFCANVLRFTAEVASEVLCQSYEFVC